MLALIDNTAQRTLQPPLHADGDFSGTPCMSAPCALAAAEDDPVESRHRREQLYGAARLVLALTGVGIGAYLGAKKSREWSAGGAMLGLAASQIVSLLFKAALLPERNQ